MSFVRGGVVAGRTIVLHMATDAGEREARHNRRGGATLACVGLRRITFPAHAPTHSYALAQRGLPARLGRMLSLTSSEFHELQRDARR